MPHQVEAKSLRGNKMRVWRQANHDKGLVLEIFNTRLPCYRESAAVIGPLTPMRHDIQGR